MRWRVDVVESRWKWERGFILKRDERVVGFGLVVGMVGLCVRNS